jgi:hypothetical protein
MPPYDRADPLKVTITYHVNDPIGPPNFTEELPFNLHMQVTFGAQFHEFRMIKNAPQKRSFCIGEGAFGGPVDIALGTVTSLRGRLHDSAGRGVDRDRRIQARDRRAG